jgi:hypothetical protein
MSKSRNHKKKLAAISEKILPLHPVRIGRPAPSEPPQGRNAARVGGCSG